MLMRFLLQARSGFGGFLCLMFLLLVGVSKAQQVPQFKFYLAFEDAKNERDTVWFVIDSNASFGWNDIQLGETPTLLSDSVFQTHFGSQGDSAFRTFAGAPNHDGGLPATPSVLGSNFIYPITVRWDTNLLYANSLPVPIQQAALTSPILAPDFPNLLKTDSLVLDSFYQGGALGNHFPIRLFLSHAAFNPIGLEETQKKPFNLYPNPVKSVLFISGAERLQGASVSVMNAQGRVVFQSKLGSPPHQIPVANLAPGCYFLNVETDHHPINDSFVKQ